MKIVLSILSVLTMLAIYSTGAFVPESQGMADTVAGLEVLSNAEMSQKLGGIDNKTHSLKKNGHNSKITWCHTNWDLSCSPNLVVTWNNTLFDCVWCGTSESNWGAYKLTFGAEIEGTSWCQYSQGNCKDFHNITYGNNCTTYITQYCVN